MLVLHTPPGLINTMYSLQSLYLRIVWQFPIPSGSLHADALLAHCRHAAGALLVHFGLFIISMGHSLALGQQVTGEIVLECVFVCMLVLVESVQPCPYIRGGAIYQPDVTCIVLAGRNRWHPVNGKITDGTGTKLMGTTDGMAPG